MLKKKPIYENKNIYLPNRKLCNTNDIWMEKSFVTNVKI